MRMIRSVLSQNSNVTSPSQANIRVTADNRARVRRRKNLTIQHLEYALFKSRVEVEHSNG